MHFESEKMQGHTRYRPADGVEISNVPDGAVAYRADRERVHFLNPTALVVYEMCGMGKSVGEIEAFLCDAFALPTPPAEAVRSCLSSLLEEGLIVAWTPSPAAP